jgi:UPF0148 protein
MEEEEAIKRITRLLEMGGTMLATHHDCGAPLFRYKGEVVCPVCSFEEAQAAKTPSMGEKVASEPLKGSSMRERGFIPADGRGEGSGSGFGGRTAIEEPSPQEPKEKGRKGHREGGSRVMVAEEEVDLALEELKAVILHKIRDISHEMRDEKDLGRLMTQLDCVKEALKILERLGD